MYDVDPRRSFFPSVHIDYVFVASDVYSTEVSSLDVHTDVHSTEVNALDVHTTEVSALDIHLAVHSAEVSVLPAHCSRRFRPLRERLSSDVVDAVPVVLLVQFDPFLFC
jgi:hypothetical protein